MNHRRAFYAFFCAFLSTGCSRAVPEVELPPFEWSKFPVGREWRMQYAWAIDNKFNALVFHVNEKLVQQCLEKSRIKYQPRIFVDDRINLAWANPLNEYVAKNYGYRIPRNNSANRKSANLKKIERCFTEVAPNTYASDSAQSHVAELVALFDLIEAPLFQYQAADPSLLKRRAVWIQCMKSKGFETKAPGDLAAQFDERGRQTKGEIRARLSELECDRNGKITELQAADERNLVIIAIQTNKVKITQLSTGREKAIQDLERIEVGSQ